MALIAGGGALLVIDHGQVTGPQALGLVAVAGATLAWSVDNTLSSNLSELHSPVVVLAKGACGATVSIALALLQQEGMPPILSLCGLLAFGAIGYGLSLRLYLLAQRRLGSARTGSVFATAPFIGWGVALLLGEPFGGGWALGAIVLMATGVYLHLTESHEHEHAHEAMEHDHADGHHLHHHDLMPVGPHRRHHRHEPIKHRHPHAEDLDHRHAH